MNLKGNPCVCGHGEDDHRTIMNRCANRFEVICLFCRCDEFIWDETAWEVAQERITYTPRWPQNIMDLIPRLKFSQQVLSETPDPFREGE